ncbi:hypothetical protein CC78DRAFT_538200 [Lojkania enalia]|uniref:AN1-type domain-containing protein n=1 Tax=Lojkania enalia TaxID=147567 RepID=A0A9P4JWN4_9PLEO|nr:hypothetical protein CC78DRAFT_538200 [Didymosphaeria enalia]
MDYHDCPKHPKRNISPVTTTTTKPSIYDYDRQCAEPKCKSLIGQGVGMKPASHCSTCNRTYCYSHRMPEDHDCKNLIPIGARPTQTTNILAVQRNKASGIFSSFKQAWSTKQAELKRKQEAHATALAEKFQTKEQKSKVQQLQELAALKKAAKGNASLAPDKRVYLHVEASADTTKAKHPTGKFFYNKTWIVGKVLDAAATALQVENVNNRGGGEENKLRVYFVEGGRILKFNEKIGDACASGNRIVLLRGVGDPDAYTLMDA